MLTLQGVQTDEFVALQRMVAELKVEGEVKKKKLSYQFRSITELMNERMQALISADSTPNLSHFEFFLCCVTQKHAKKAESIAANFTDQFRIVQQNNASDKPKEHVVQSFFNEFLHSICQHIETSSVFRDTSLKGSKAAAKNYKVDCCFVSRSSAPGQDCNASVHFADIRQMAELKHKGSMNIKRTMSQLTERNDDMLYIYHRKFVYSFRSEGENIVFYRCDNNGTVISSGELPFMYLQNNKAKIDKGFLILLGMMLAPDEALGYTSQSICKIPEEVISYFKLQQCQIRFCSSGHNSDVFSVNDKSVLKCYKFMPQFIMECSILRQFKQDMNMEHLGSFVHNGIGFLLRSPYTSSTLQSMKFEVTAFKNMVSEVMAALQFLHNTCQCVHGDISPDNILYDEAKQCFILNDFGLARTIKNCKSAGFFGNYVYCSNRWVDVIVRNEKVVPTILFDYENFFFVVLWYSTKQRRCYPRLPWENEMDPTNIASNKYLFCSKIEKERSHPFFTTYCNIEVVDFMKSLGQSLWSGESTDVCIKCRFEKVVDEFSQEEASKQLTKPTVKVSSSLEVLSENEEEADLVKTTDSKEEVHNPVCFCVRVCVFVDQCLLNRWLPRRRGVIVRSCLRAWTRKPQLLV